MLPNVGPSEMMLLMFLGVMLFGKRLPEIGRSLGKSVVEFKKGLSGVTDDMLSDEPVPSRGSRSRD